MGTFERQKGGRVRFAFDAALLAFFRASAAPCASAANSRTVTPAAAAAAPARPRTSEVALPAFLREAGVSANARGLADLHALCVDADPSDSGTVRRLAMERWLGREGRALLGQLSAATVLDLLHAHSCGVFACSLFLTPSVILR